jgi:hypothetical protein
MRRVRAAASLVGVMCLVGALAGCQPPPVAGPTPRPTTAASQEVTTPAGSPSPGATSASEKGVVAAELRRIAVMEVGFDQPVSPVTSVAMGNAINPPLYAPGRPSAPIRVADKGVQPSSDASDTVYVGCHTSVSHGPQQYPCDVLTRAVQPGFHVIATTDAGTLTYVVDKTRSIPYADFAPDVETWAIVPKRLVFVMCDILDGTPTHMNYVIYATLAA